MMMEWHTAKCSNTAEHASWSGSSLFLRTALTLEVGPMSYDCLIDENLLNSITLHVRVPVLSEKMYLIWPSSSLIEEQLTLICMFCFSQYISMSYCINDACQNLTSSRVTSSEMGTKLVKINTHVPASDTNKCLNSESHSLFGLNAKYGLSRLCTVHVAPMNAAMHASEIYSKKMIAIDWLVWFMMRDVLYLPLELFIWIFVSLPVYTTIPITNSVFLSDMPLSMMLSLESGILS